MTVCPEQVRAVRVGEEGFVAFAKALHRLRVLDRADVHAWIRFHGAVVRATQPAFDDGEHLDEHGFAALAFELGKEAE